MPNDSDFDFEPTTDSVDKAALSRLIGRNIRQIDGMVREGMPAIRTGAVRAPLRFRVPDVVDWMVERAGGDDDLGAIKRRDRAAAAEMRELNLAKARGALIEIETLRPWLREKFAVLRSRILSIPQQVPNLVPEQREALLDAINDALTDVSGARAEEVAS